MNEKVYPKILFKVLIFVFIVVLLNRIFVYGDHLFLLSKFFREMYEKFSLFFVTRVFYEIFLIIVFAIIMYGIIKKKKWTINFGMITIGVILLLDLFWFFLVSNDDIRTIFYINISNLTVNFIVYTVIVVNLVILKRYQMLSN